MSRIPFISGMGVAMLMLLASAIPVAASHDLVSVYIGYGNRHTTGLLSADEEACGATTTCNVTLAVQKPYYQRLKAWCGGTVFNLTIAPGDTSSRVECGGPGFIAYQAILRDPDFEHTTHEDPVNVTITVVEAAT